MGQEYVLLVDAYPCEGCDRFEVFQPGSLVAVGVAVDAGGDLVVVAGDEVDGAVELFQPRRTAF